MIASFSPLKPFGIRLDVEPGVKATDLPRAELLALLAEHKLVLVRGLARVSRDELLAFAAKDPARDLLQWNFGPVMELSLIHI